MKTEAYSNFVCKSSEEKYETTYPIIYMADKYTGKKHLAWSLFKQNSDR